MKSRWLCFWTWSGPPDCTLNKYPIHRRKCVRCVGSVINKQRPASVETSEVTHNGGPRGRYTKSNRCLINRYNVGPKSFGWFQDFVCSQWCWNKSSLCLSDKVSVTTGSKLFANKYLILTPWVILISSHQIIHKCKVSLEMWLNFEDLKFLHCWPREKGEKPKESLPKLCLKPKMCVGGYSTAVISVTRSVHFM